MADDLCFFTKEPLDPKAPKKSPLVLRMVFLLLAMASGVCICLFCLRQIGTRTQAGIMNIQVPGQSCPALSIEPGRVPYLHYPEPETFSRNECSCNPVRFFAILSTQRSGSGWFETLLNSHINISSNGEIFSVKVRRSNISTIVDTLDRIYRLDWFTSASKNECTAAVGLKWMLNQGLMQHHEEIVDYFNRRGVSAIFLFRRNLLRRMVSVLANAYDRDHRMLNGTHKSHVHSHHEAELLATYKPLVNATLLLPSLQQVEDMNNKALEYFNSTRHIVLYYEDLLNNRTKLKDVQEFLMVPQKDLKSRQVKIHKAPLSEQVQNWDDVEKALKNSRYEKFLQADYQL